MPKRSSKNSRQGHDPNLIAARVVREATGQAGEPAAVETSPPKKKNPAAVELGRLGGKKGGKARARVLSAKERSDIARKAARARWRKKKNESEDGV
jgi:hypothetical protein